MVQEEPRLFHRDGLWHGSFTAMAGPCEVLMDIDDRLLANMVLQTTYQEAKRVEQKFSRYRDDNIIHRINHAHGQPVTVDDETARLLDYADTCFQLSDGLFDITSGVLRRVWRFDGSDNIPSRRDVDAVLAMIGWQKVGWSSPQLCLPDGMEIDFGGIGKEYAVDSAAQLVAAQMDHRVLINFGGDLRATGPRRHGKPWRVAVDDPTASGKRHLKTLPLKHGAVATSGDARRFLLKDGHRYSHILNPRTGWPVPDAPRSVTVVAATCLEAGMLSTFAMLQGKDAESFLKQQGVRFWCVR